MHGGHRQNRGQSANCGVSLPLLSSGQPSFCVRWVPEAHLFRLNFILHILFHISGNNLPILNQQNNFQILRIMCSRVYLIWPTTTRTLKWCHHHFLLLWENSLQSEGDLGNIFTLASMSNYYWLLQRRFYLACSWRKNSVNIWLTAFEGQPPEDGLWSSGKVGVSRVLVTSCISLI